MIGYWPRWLRFTKPGSKEEPAPPQPFRQPGPRITEKTSTSRKVVMNEAEFMRLLGLPGETTFSVSVIGSEVTVYLMSRE